MSKYIFHTTQHRTTPHHKTTTTTPRHHSKQQVEKLLSFRRPRWRTKRSDLVCLYAMVQALGLATAQSTNFDRVRYWSGYLVRYLLDRKVAVGLFYLEVGPTWSLMGSFTGSYFLWNQSVRFVCCRCFIGILTWDLDGVVTELRTRDSDKGFWLWVFYSSIWYNFIHSPAFSRSKTLHFVLWSIVKSAVSIKKPPQPS